MKRLTMILGLFTLLLVSLSNAQQRWERTYGGLGDDWSYSVQQTTDGGYIIQATTTSYGAGRADVYLFKTDASGDTLWTKTYGGAYIDGAYSVQQTQEGGYIVAGYTNSFGAGDYDVYLIKTKPNGDTVWTRTYGGDSADYGFSVRQTLDGGYIISGYTESYGAGSQDVWLIKTNPSGDTLWTRTFGGAGWDRGYSVQQTSDGGYIVGGITTSLGNIYAWLIKTDSTGNNSWTKTYGGAKGAVGWPVQQTQDGGYIMAGATRSYGDTLNGDVWLIKTNVSGDTLWTRTYGGRKGENSFSVQQTQDGGYIIAGLTYSFNDSLNGDVYLIKTNLSGDTLWTRSYGGMYWDEGNYVQQTSDNGYIIAGQTNSFGMGRTDVYLIKTDSLGRSTGVEEDRQGDKGTRRQGERLRATPNPFTSFATLPGHEAERFSLYDVSGRKVGVFKGDRVGEGLAPGVYFLRSSDSQAKPLRIVKVR
jgi:hypothetical protein